MNFILKDMFTIKRKLPAVVPLNKAFQSEKCTFVS